MIATDLLQNVKITAPCPARWEDMTGSEQCRFCAHCQKNVYNFSAMTAEEVVEMLQKREGKLCARYYQRPDGTIMTSDCGLGQSRYVTMFQRAFLGAAAIVMALISSAFGENAQIRATKLGQVLSSSGSASTRSTPPRLMGEIACVPAAKTTSTNPPVPMLLGKISCAPLSTNQIPKQPRLK